jgi:hypothetical protein
MKKSEFKQIVKEIIKEVIDGMPVTKNEVYGEIEPENEPPEGKAADIDMTGVASPTGKTDKAWRGKMRTLDKIHKSPEFLAKLAKLRTSQGEPAPGHEVPTEEPKQAMPVGRRGDDYRPSAEDADSIRIARKAAGLRV